MEKVHVDKDGITAKPDLASSEIQQWASEAYEDCSTDDSSHEITYTEVRRTFHQCSNTPGPDGVTSQMIDSANRHDRVSVSTMERSLEVQCRSLQAMEIGAQNTASQTWQRKLQRV